MRKKGRKLRFEKLESRELFAVLSFPDLSSLDLHSRRDFKIPVGIDSAEGIRGVALQIRYEPAKIVLTSQSITPGEVWGGQGMAIANVNNANGQVTAFLFATIDLPAATGNLLELNFKVRADVTDLANTDLQIESLRINEGKLNVSSIAKSTLPPNESSSFLDYNERASPNRTTCNSPAIDSLTADGNRNSKQELASPAMARQNAIEPKLLHLGSLKVSRPNNLPHQPNTTDQEIQKVESDRLFPSTGNTASPLDDIESKNRRNRLASSYANSDRNPF